MPYIISQSVGIGGNTVGTSSALEITSTTGALVVPRMTTTQQNALTDVEGMMIYDTVLDKFAFNENSTWKTVMTTASNTGKVTYSDLDDDLAANSAIAASAVDWSLGKQYTKTIGASTTFTFSNYVLNKTIIMRLIGGGSSYTITWPSSVKIISGAYDDTASVVNLIVLYCSNATGASEEVWVTIYQE